MDLFINGIGLVSPQRTTIDGTFLNQITGREKEYHQNIEPDYKEYISPYVYRRLSRLLKTSLASAKMCLMNSGIEKPDAIIVGTGLGCIEATENFLIELLQKNEELLSPTQFIYSTHNTISSQIALLLKCYGYNITFAHRSFSFENALLDSYLLLKDNPQYKILVGGADEITEHLFALRKNIGAVRNLGKNKNIATGEGSIFFMVSSEQSEKSGAKIKGITTSHKLKCETLGLEEIILDTLAQAGLDRNDIYLMICGKTGHTALDKIYLTTTRKLFPGITQIPYKHLCGDYFTASSFALALAINIIKFQRIPRSFGLSSEYAEIKNILIYNYDKNFDTSIIIIGKC